mgnify:CR=1 FL=1|jgi:hypothetical protein
MEISEILSNYAQLGFDAINVDEEMAIADFIEKNQENCPVPLYRGIYVDHDFELAVGDKVDFQNLFSSFDERFEVAQEFADRGAKGVIFVLENPIGLPIYNYTDDTSFGETEWLILDNEYIVKEVEEQDNLIIAKIEVAA